jgi:hypothetical protein
MDAKTKSANRQRKGTPPKDRTKIIVIQTSEKETDALRLNDLAKQYGLNFRRVGSTYKFEDFNAHGLRQALGFAEGFDRAMLARKPANAASNALLDAVVWAVCPHITRWSDSNWHEYAPESQRCRHCPESETIDGHEVVCPWRCDAEDAAKAVLKALADEQEK